jgi:hypothetical protein
VSLRADYDISWGEKKKKKLENFKRGMMKVMGEMLSVSVPNA